MSMSDKENKKDRKEYKSALNVQRGIEQPDSINPEVIKKFRKNKKISRPVEEYVDGIINGNRTILGQAITLIESSLPDHNRIAQEIIEKCLPYAGNSIRIGITGVPGVGKSTFIESMGKYITSKGNKLAVLAVDPSSERSKGSILGDKTRMEELSNDPGAFIRPSPSAGSLGGVARKTRETIILCEAAGFNTIFIETVGVGQSETAVHSMVDFFLLLMLAGAGDELQGIKRGIMEMADTIAINKIDEATKKAVTQAVREYKNALHLYPETKSGWSPEVTTCSALTEEGIGDIWEIIQEYIALTKDNGYFQNQRNRQAKHWMYDTISNQLKERFYQNPAVQKQQKAIEQKVLNGEISSFAAAEELLKHHKTS